MYINVEEFQKDLKDNPIAPTKYVDGDSDIVKLRKNVSPPVFMFCLEQFDDTFTDEKSGVIDESFVNAKLVSYVRADLVSFAEMERIRSKTE